MTNTSSTPGSSLRLFMVDETNVVRDSWSGIGPELALFDALDELFTEWPNKDRGLLDGESKYFALRFVARHQLYQAFTALLRRHTSAAFSSSRIGVEAAFYAAMISGGFMSESDYLHDDAKRAGISRQARNAIKAGKAIPSMVKSLLEAMDFLSSVGPHAEPKAWGRSMTTTEAIVSMSLFDRFDDEKQFNYFFLSLLWYGSLTLKTFLNIARDDFQIDTSTLLTSLEKWEAQADARRIELGFS